MFEAITSWGTSLGIMRWSGLAPLTDKWVMLCKISCVLHSSDNHLEDSKGPLRSWDLTLRTPCIEHNSHELYSSCLCHHFSFLPICPSLSLLFHSLHLTQLCICPLVSITYSYLFIPPVPLTSWCSCVCQWLLHIRPRGGFQSCPPQRSAGSVPDPTSHTATSRESPAIDDHDQIKQKDDATTS